MTLSEPINVACVHKSGGDFTSEYVERLRDGVRDNLSVPYRFLCLTDYAGVTDGCERISLIHNLKGWWSKLELFNLTNPTIYFDLDTVINGRLEPLVNLAQSRSFWMLSDLNKRSRALTSGVMVWNGDYSHILGDIDKDNFERYKTPHLWGDQGWISNRVAAMPMQPELPSGFICSHKWSTIEERQAASVICYHGKPRPHETGWAI